MAKKPKFLADIQKYRKSLGQNQVDFWGRYGITQSAGSRYESGRALPTPSAMLIYLAESELISEQDLRAAAKAVKPYARG